MPEPISPHPTTPTVLIDTFRGVFTSYAPPCAFGYPPTRSRRSESGARCSPSRLPLDHYRDALAAADARGGQTVGALPAAQLQRQRQQQAGARRAQRMSQRDGAAIDVRARAIEAQLLLHGQVLSREGFV